MGIRELLKKWFRPPPKRVIRSWIVDEAEPIPIEEGGKLWVVWAGFAGFWGRVRTRVFRAFAGLLAIVNLGLAVLLYSNVWYMNLILYAILIPNFLILIHYLRLTKDV